MFVFHALGRVGRLVHDPDRHALAGIGNSALNIASAQASLGFRVTACGFSDPFPVGHGNWNGVKIITLKSWKFARLSARLDLSLLLPILCQTLKNPSIDILHVHELALLYLPFAKARVIHLHIPLREIAGKSHLWRRADAVICVSEYVRRAFLKTSEYPPQRTHVVYNGAVSKALDGSEIENIRAGYGLSPSDVMILFVGALVPKKGPDILLKAVHELSLNSNRPGSHLKTFIVGGSRLWRARGDDLKAEAYEDKLQELSSGIDVTFLGTLPHHEVQRIYQACDIHVVPSLFQEPHPLVVCEGMAAGKPVIASQVGGIPETIIDGETGILFPKGDVGALASAISKLVVNQDIRFRMGRAAKERSRIFSWESAAKKLDQIYQELL